LIRSCFTNDDEEKEQEAAEIRRKIRKFLLGPGGSGRAFHRGYDVDGRVCVHSIVINTPWHNRTDQEGYMESCIFILEKSIACSAKRSRRRQMLLHKNGSDDTTGSDSSMLPTLRQRLDGLKMIASVNFADFEGWMNLPIAVNRDLLSCLQNHYPETLHRMYFCDAPLYFAPFGPYSNHLSMSTPRPSFNSSRARPANRPSFTMTSCQFHKPCPINDPTRS
jgi:CRAL/TRIO domain